MKPITVVTVVGRLCATACAPNVQQQTNIQQQKLKCPFFRNCLNIRFFLHLFNLPRITYVVRYFIQLGSRQYVTTWFSRSCPNYPVMTFHPIPDLKDLAPLTTHYPLSLLSYTVYTIFNTFAPYFYGHALLILK